MKDFEKTFKALANKRRLAIVKYLKNKKEAPVWDVSEEIKLSFKATSKHLNLLSNADILDKEQRNTEVFYNLSSKSKKIVKDIISYL